jgi:hypothetical protein
MQLATAKFRVICGGIDVAGVIPVRAEFIEASNARGLEGHRSRNPRRLGAPPAERGRG